jgi:hypothetical protein
MKAKSYLQSVTGESREGVVTLELGKGLRDRRSQIDSMSVIVFIKEEACGVRKTICVCSSPIHTKSWMTVAVHRHRKAVEPGAEDVRKRRQ